MRVIKITLLLILVCIGSLSGKSVNKLRQDLIKGKNFNEPIKEPTIEDFKKAKVFVGEPTIINGKDYTGLPTVGKLGECPIIDNCDPIKPINYLSPSNYAARAYMNEGNQLTIESQILYAQRCLIYIASLYDLYGGLSIMGLKYSSLDSRNLDEINLYQKCFRTYIRTEDIPTSWDIDPAYANFKDPELNVFHDWKRNNCSLLLTTRIDIGALMKLKLNGKNLVTLTNDGFNFIYSFNYYFTQAYAHDIKTSSIWDKMIFVIPITFTVSMSSNNSYPYDKIQVYIDAESDSSYNIISRLTFLAPENWRVISGSCVPLNNDFIITQKSDNEVIYVKSTRSFSTENPPILSVQCDTYNGTNTYPTQYLNINYTAKWDPKTANGTIKAFTRLYQSNTSNPYLNPIFEGGPIGVGGRVTLYDNFPGTLGMKVTTKYLYLSCQTQCYDDGIKVMLAWDDVYRCIPIGSSNISKTICDDFNDTQIACPDGSTNGKCVTMGVFPATIGGVWMYEGSYLFENPKLYHLTNDGEIPPFSNQTVYAKSPFVLAKN